MTLLERVLHVLSDPNIAFLLLTLGGLGLLIELVHPGVFFPGVFGAISLILAFFVLGTLPVNWAGVALIGLAFVLSWRWSSMSAASARSASVARLR